MKEGSAYGYARVSTKDQKEDRQMAALLTCGVKRQNIFLDKQSGKDFNRPQYRRLLRRLRRGDTLFVKSIDRLGRNYEEITAQWRLLTKEMQIGIVVLDIPLLDTREKGKNLTGVFIADMVLQILSYVAQAEREFIHQRQAEGIVAARARGVRFGRPPKEKPEAFERVFTAWQARALSCREAAATLGVAPGTFRVWTEERGGTFPRIPRAFPVAKGNFPAAPD